MSIDAQRRKAVTKLQELGWSWENNDWVQPAHTTLSPMQVASAASPRVNGSWVPAPKRPDFIQSLTNCVLDLRNEFRAVGSDLGKLISVSSDPGSQHQQAFEHALMVSPSFPSWNTGLPTQYNMHPYRICEVAGVQFIAD